MGELRRQPRDGKAQRGLGVSRPLHCSMSGSKQGSGELQGRKICLSSMRIFFAVCILVDPIITQQLLLNGLGSLNGYTSEILEARKN